MIIETKEIYKCSYCRKLYQIKNACIYHERVCTKNPANHRLCFSCEHLTKKETQIYSGVDDYFSSEPVNTKKEFLFCEAKDIFLYTPKNEIKGNYILTDADGGYFENYPMVKQCELFK